MVLNNIDYLFHYTSIEKLALILKNRTIRLNALKNVDDLQESKTKDLNNLGRFFFVSSWTDDETESIPMWNMYTKMDSGVRIGLPKNPFSTHETTNCDMKKVFPNYKVEGENSVSTFLNMADMMRAGVFSPQAWEGDILKKIIYTANKELLEPTVIFSVGDKININFEKMGTYKNLYWKFQKEWRYIMCFLPIKFDTDLSTISDDVNKMVVRLLEDSQEGPFDYYDLDIRSDAFSNMLVTPSPKMTSGNRIVLDSLLKEYNPGVSIKESELQGLI